ncbi:hypothetical protein [Lyngbya sp. PCC 8106]|nr:hypothetical protein [Lyngbya sp. PCC 8106]
MPVACLPDEDGLVNGALDWLIEIRSPDQSTVDYKAEGKRE